MGVAKRAWPWAKCPKIEIFYPNFFQYLGPPECKSKVRPRVPRRFYGIFARYWINIVRAVQLIGAGHVPAA